MTEWLLNDSVVNTTSPTPSAIEIGTSQNETLNLYSFLDALL